MEALGIDDTAINPDGTLKDLQKNGHKSPLTPYEKKMTIVVTGVSFLELYPSLFTNAASRLLGLLDLILLTF